MGEYILACDEGTSSVRCVAFDRQGDAVSSSQLPLTSRFPRLGWVEQDANEIWRKQLACITNVINQLSVALSDIHALGITNQRETTVVWDRDTAEPIAPSITWQCSRTAEECAKIRESGKAAWIAETTGLQVDPYFSATKLGWILANVPQARQRAEDGELLFGTIDSWLIYRLTAGEVHAIDRTNASRTMLMVLETGTWDSGLLEYFQIPATMMPTIVPSKGILGYCNSEVVGYEIPIAGVAGDQQAAMVGQACTYEDSAKLTYGTGAFLLVHTGSKRVQSKHGLLSTAVASMGDEEEFALEGSVFSAGSAVQWLRDSLGLISSASETESMANSVPDSNGVYLVPAFEGLGAPHWAPEARGALVGLTRSTDRRHIARATLESIALQCFDLLETFTVETGRGPEMLRVDGGAAANDFLLQLQADLLELPVVRPKQLESTVLGVANLAANATEFWDELPYEIDRTFEPSMSATERDALLNGWREAIRRVL